MMLQRLVGVFTLWALPALVHAGTPAEQLLLAKGFLQRGEIAYAKQELESVLRQEIADSIRVEATYWLGESHYRLGEYREAAQHFDYVARASVREWEFDTLMRLGDSHVALNEFSAAADAFRRATRTASGEERGNASYWLAVALSREGRHEEAARAFAAASRREGEAGEEAAYMAARSAMSARSWALAESLWAGYVSAHPLSQRAEEGMLALAHLSVRQDREHEAVRLLESLLGRFPNGRHAHEAMLLVGELELRAGNAASAAAWLGKLVRSAPTRQIGLRGAFTLGRALRDAHREPEAVSVLDSLAAAHPEDSLATEGLLDAGEVLYGQGRFPEAASRLQEVLRRSVPPDAEMRARRLLGWSLYQQGHWADARVVFGALADLPAASRELAAEASHMAAQSLAKMESLEAAVTALQASLEAFPGWESADRSLILLARLLEAQGRTSEAIDAYSRLADSYPSSDRAPEARLRAAQLLLDQGRETESRGILEGLVAEKHTGALYWLAEVHYRLGRADLAASHFREFLQLSVPNDPLRDEAWHGLAWSLTRTGDSEGAERALVEMLQEAPTGPLAEEAHLKLGSIRYEAHRPAEAAQAFRMLLDRFPGGDYGDQALFWLGWSLLAQDSVAQACAVFAGFDRSFPGSQLAARAKLASGRCRLSEGRPTEALEELQKAIRSGLPPDGVAEAWAAMVQAYLDLGLLRHGRAAIDSALDQGGGAGELAASMLELSGVWLDQGDRAPALGLLDSLVSLFPACPEADEARYLAAIARLRLGDQEGASRGFQELADSHDDEIRARSLLGAGQIATRTGMHEQALGWYRQAAEAASDDAVLRQALYGEALALQELGRGASSAAVLERLATLFPGHRDNLWEEASLQWAQLLQTRGDHADALAVARQLIDHQGALRTRALLVAGNALRSLGRHPEAAEMLLDYSALEPHARDAAQARYLAALSLMQAEQWGDAASVFEEVARSAEFGPQALLARGWCLQKAGNDSQAEVSFRRVLAIAPGSERAWEAGYRLAELLLSAQKAEEAAAAARAAIEGGATRSAWGDDLVLLMGRALEVAGHGDEAVLWFQRIVDEYPQSELLPYAESRLRALGGDQ
jgi:TolA-binding protein